MSLTDATFHLTCSQAVMAKVNIPIQVCAHAGSTGFPSIMHRFLKFFFVTYRELCSVCM